MSCLHVLFAVDIFLLLLLHRKILWFHLNYTDAAPFPVLDVFSCYLPSGYSISMPSCLPVSLIILSFFHSIIISFYNLLLLLLFIKLFIIFSSFHLISSILCSIMNCNFCHSPQFTYISVLCLLLNCKIFWPIIFSYTTLFSVWLKCSMFHFPFCWFALS